MKPLSITLLGLLTACGGGSDPTPPPPPQPPPVPASLAFVAGDNQTAEPGVAVPVAPKVIVRDATGRPVSGVAVAFVIDSGAGSVSTPSTATGADGTASTGWTLGPVAGTNTLVASVPGLASVRVRCNGRIQLRVLIDTTAVAPGGGTLAFERSGDSLAGIQLRVFDSTYQQSVRFTIAVDRWSQLTLPNDLRQIGPVFVVGSDGGFAARPMTLRLPARVGADSAVAAFLFDPAAGVFEGVPLLARDDSSVTIASRHFRTDQMFHTAVPAAGFRSSRVGAPLRFGEVRIVVVGGPRAVTTRPITTAFLPGKDDWEFHNYGTFKSTGGVCAGMSLSALYYFYRFQPTRGGLFRHFDSFADLEWDNPGGEAAASILQVRSDWDNQTHYLHGLIASVGGSASGYASLVYESLALTMMVTGQPQYLGLNNPTSGHAVVAYAVDNGTVKFSNPNAPGLLTQKMTHRAAGFDPVPLSPSYTDPEESFTSVHMVGASVMVDATLLAKVFADIDSKTIAAKWFPTLRREYFDLDDRVWKDLPADNTINTPGRALALRTRCIAECTRVRPQPPTDRITTEISDNLGKVLGTDAADSDSAAVIVFGRGPYPFRVSWQNFHRGLPEPRHSFLGQEFLTIITRPFFIKPTPPVADANVDLTLTASSAGLPTATSTFVWDFGDGTPTVSKLADSVVTHQWKALGKFLVTVELRSREGKRLAFADDSVEVRPSVYGWLFESTGLAGATLPPGGIGPERTDTLIYNRMSSWIFSLQTNPSGSGLIAFATLKAGKPDCPGGVTVAKFPRGWNRITSIEEFQGVLALCGEPDYTGSFSMSPLGTGRLDGSASWIPQPDELSAPGGSIGATMEGKVLRGQFVVLVRYSNGMGSYTVDFTADQAFP